MRVIQAGEQGVRGSGVWLDGGVEAFSRNHGRLDLNGGIREPFTGEDLGFSLSLSRPARSVRLSRRRRWQKEAQGGVRTMRKESRDTCGDEISTACGEILEHVSGTRGAPGTRPSMVLAAGLISIQNLGTSKQSMRHSPQSMTPTKFAGRPVHTPSKDCDVS